MWYFKKKYYVFHSNSEKIPELSKIFMIKNNNNNLISLKLLFQNVYIIFTKKIENFSDISREKYLKISHEKNFSEKYECQSWRDKDNFE